MTATLSLTGHSSAAARNGDHPRSTRPAPPTCSRQEWADDPRWAGIERSYTAEDVVRLRGTVQEEHTLARRGAERLWNALHDQDVHPRAGRADRQPGRADGARRAARPSTCPAGRSPPTRNLAGQTYPDQSLYPANSVPAVVRRINNALLRADQIDHSAPARPAPTTWCRSSPTPRPASAAR